MEFNFLTQNLKHFFYFRRELLELEKFLTFPGKKLSYPNLNKFLIHIHTHTHTHIYIYIYIYICTYTYLYFLVYLHIYIYMHTNTKKIVYCLAQHVWSWCKSNFFLLKKKTKAKIGRPEHSLTQHPLLPLTSQFWLSPQSRPSFQSGRHMCNNPK